MRASSYSEPSDGFRTSRDGLGRAKLDLPPGASFVPRGLTAARLAAIAEAHALLRAELAARAAARIAARRRLAVLAVVAAAGVALGCASAEGARRGARPVGSVEHGKASFYGRGFAGRKTANGERFDPNAMTGAHPSLPFGTRVRVTRANGSSVTVRINDRCGCPGGRIIDLSEGAARRLGMIKEGVVAVRLEVIGK